MLSNVEKKNSVSEILLTKAEEITKKQLGEAKEKRHEVNLLKEISTRKDINAIVDNINNWEVLDPVKKQKTQEALNELVTGFNKCNERAMDVYLAHTRIIEDLLKKDDLTFDERSILLGRLSEIAKMMQKETSEARLQTLAAIGLIVVGAVGVAYVANRNLNIIHLP